MTTPPTPSSRHSGVAIWIALGFGVLGVGAVASGVGLLLAAPEQSTSSTVAITTTFTVPGSSTVVTAPTTTATTSIGGGFEASLTLTDDSGVLTVSVPPTWFDVDLGQWGSDGEEFGPSISAATDRAAWVDGWGTPGFFVGLTSAMTFDDAFGDFSGACLLDHTLPLEVDGLTGASEWWNDCGVERSELFVGVVELEDGSGIILFQIVAVDGGIADLVDAILGTFRYQ
ncbi:MAG: hypothetical protein AAB198_05225 [Actinomycetota bacterium]